MILQCPQCNARFTVPDAAIPPHGRTVKCSRCAHNWHAPGVEEAAESFATAMAALVDDDMPATAAAPMAVATPMQSPTPMDAVTAVEVQPFGKPNAKRKPAMKARPIPKRPLVMATPVLALAWLVLAFMTHYDRWMHLPVLSSIYNAVGVHPTDGLVFDDVTMQQKTSDGKTAYVLSGSIANQSAGPRIVPSVRVILNDAAGKKLWEREYIVNEPLKGGDVYPFRITNVETSFGDKVAAIVVDVGHPLQLMMR